MSLYLKDISIRSRAGLSLFAPLSLKIPSGKVFTVVGPSGIGKSTLLDAIGGHLKNGFHLTGSVVLNGRNLTNLPPESRRIGVMFQDEMLFPHLSVGDNLAFGLPATMRGKEIRRAAVDSALDQSGLSKLYDRDPATLSGGQRSRAALMRTILAEPHALLLDEPFSKLDNTLRNEISCFVLAFTKSNAIPTLMVTHKSDDAAATGGTMLELKLN